MKSSGKDVLPGAFFPSLPSETDRLPAAPSRQGAKGPEGAGFLRYLFLPSPDRTLYNVPKVLFNGGELLHHGNQNCHHNAK